MKEKKGLEVLSFDEIMKEDHGPEITWKHDKNWINTYNFKEAFIKALKSWDLWKL